MDEIIDFIKDPKLGLFNVNKLYPKIKKLGYDISKKELTDIIHKEYFYEMTKPQSKPIFNQIYAPDVGDNFQIDIMIYDRYTYHNYKYILCCIDVKSRYAQCRPMTNRNNETILKNLKDIFNEMGIPKSISCDLEFNTHSMKKYADDNNIEFYFSEANDTVKNGIVERFNRTIANLLQKYRLASNRYDWYKYLYDIVDNYNNTIHSTTKETPYDVFNHITTSKQVIRPKVKHIFSIGDNVRIINKKNTFDKGDTIIYSKDIYKISDIDKNKIYLENVERSYKPYQLKKANETNIKINTRTDERKKRNILKRENIDAKNITRKKRTYNSTKSKDYIY